MLEKHEVFEKNSLLLTVGILIVVAIGGLVEIAPLFYIENTIEKVEGMRPYTPLEQQGRNIYVREGCYLCHSQMIRPLRDEVERYGHYSLAAESMYDHPFQWCSKRTGPDLARVGGKYSDDWHQAHMADPRSIVPESVMPTYAFLNDNMLKDANMDGHLKALRVVGVPYSDAQVAAAKSDLFTQLDEYADDYDGFVSRYPNAKVRDFDGNPELATEMDALIAYLQMLGTLVNFDEYEALAEENLR
jgi:cytochrome c oxidase cbb3-type subunit 2